MKLTVLPVEQSVTQKGQSVTLVNRSVTPVEHIPPFFLSLFL